MYKYLPGILLCKVSYTFICLYFHLYNFLYDYPSNSGVKLVETLTEPRQAIWYTFKFNSICNPKLHL